MRFNKEINSFDEGVEYYKNRAIQLLKYNYFLTEIIEYNYGVAATFIDNNKNEYKSIYIYKNMIGKNYFEQFMIQNNYPTILTSDDCNLEIFLLYKNYPHKVVNIYEFGIYHLISNFYGDRKAKRSGLYYMNHIDEGLAILKWMNIDNYITNAAYALHPLVQMDNDLDEFISSKEYDYIQDYDMNIIIHMMEYRSVANEYLSTRIINSIDEIRLSPLYKVNDMLIADKIQNRKDFELYHIDTHPRSLILQGYFNDWLERLKVSEDEYQSIKARLIINPKIILLN